MLDRIKVILESHKGNKNSITSKEIAKAIGIVEDDTHAKTRALILKCIEQNELPVVANNRGYYFICDQAEYEEYIKNPVVTKQRMFFETMEEVLPGLKVIIESPTGDVQTFYPIESFANITTNGATGVGGAVSGDYASVEATKDEE